MHVNNKKNGNNNEKIYVYVRVTQTNEIWYLMRSPYNED